MSATTFSFDAAPAARGQRARLAQLSAIVLVHVVAFYFISSGMLTRAIAGAVPQEVYVNFVTPPAPPKPTQPDVPHAVALVQPMPLLTPPLPEVQIAPSERAITLPKPAATTERSSVPTVAAGTTPAPPAQGPKTISSGVEYVQPPQPQYPVLSKRMGEQGKVVLRILVTEKGLPDQVTIQTSSGFARLDEAGRQAALRAVFKPHMEDGRPVAVFVIVPLNFQLSA